MKSVLLVGDPAQVAPLREALASSQFDVRSCLMADLEGTLASARPDALAFAPSDVGPALRQAVEQTRAGGVPFVVALGRRDLAVRDQVLIHGATDVSLDPAPEDLLGRVRDLLAGWTRQTPRRALPAIFRALRGRERLELRVTEIDPSGFVLAQADGTTPGELLKVQVPLPTGELVAWGRVAESEGVRGVRFVALAPEERQRLIIAIQGRRGPDTGATTAPSVLQVGARPTPVPPPPVPGSPIGPRPAAVAAPTPAGTPIVPGPPPGATPSGGVPRASAPPTVPSGTPQAPRGPVSMPPRVPNLQRPTTQPHLTPAPMPAASPSAPPPAPAAESATAPARPATPVSVPAPARPATPVSVPTLPRAATPVSVPVAPALSPAPALIPAPPPALVLGPSDAVAEPLAASDAAATEPAVLPVLPEAREATLPLAKAIASIVDPVTDPAVEPAHAPNEGDVLAAMLGKALEKRFPSTTWVQEPSLEALATCASLGLAPEADGAPPGEHIVEFLRTITPLERRLFDKEPPAEFPDPVLARRCLALRLRTFALVREAEKKLADGPWAVDDCVLGPFLSETRSADADLQKLLDGFMARAETAKIKDATVFRNALTKGTSDLKGMLSRLKGEQVLQAGSTALLDVAERLPGQEQTQPTWRREAPKEKEEEQKKPDKPDFVLPNAAQTSREKRRIAWWSAAFVLLLALRLATLGRAPVVVTDLGVPGLISAKISQDAAKGVAPALVVAADGWVPKEADYVKLKAALRAKGVKGFRIVSTDGVLYASGRTGEQDETTLVRRPKPRK